MAVQHTLNGFYEEQADRRADLRAVVPLSPGDKREGRRRDISGEYLLYIFSSPNQGQAEEAGGGGGGGEG